MAKPKGAMGSDSRMGQIYKEGIFNYIDRQQAPIENNENTQQKIEYKISDISVEEAFNNELSKFINNNPSMKIFKTTAKTSTIGFKHKKMKITIKEIK